MSAGVIKASLTTGDGNDKDEVSAHEGWEVAGAGRIYSEGGRPSSSNGRGECPGPIPHLQQYPDLPNVVWMRVPIIPLDGSATWSLWVTGAPEMENARGIKD